MIYEIPAAFVRSQLQLHLTTITNVARCLHTAFVLSVCTSKILRYWLPH